MAVYHLPVDNRWLSVRESVATPFVAGKLAVPEGSPIAFVERLCSVGGLPLSLDTSSLRPEAIPVLLDADVSIANLFSLIERELGVRLGWAEVTTEPVAADAETSKLLAIRPGAPL